MKRYRLSILWLAATAIMLTAAIRADDVAKDYQPNKTIAEKNPCLPEPGSWSAELSTGTEFSNVRADRSEGSTQLPSKVTAVYTLDEVSNDLLFGGIFRGNTDFLFSGTARAIFGGREHHIFGFQSGPRYNFVQPGWKVIPFVESEVGLGFADSHGRYPIRVYGPSGLGQDFNFTFSVGAGIKYKVTDRVYSRLAIKFVHFSNAGLSEPGRQNEGIDAAGPEISLGFQF